ncbi:PLCG1 [Lepeophtheirus salmonis]|uniref:Phosphoinositide phospholipase C n=1 Tax=Lepeophtheirus salmonis TaxID=72036 RepID=A0A7R8H3Y6_LEPSM|nr:PLCG1 [Lepeophtheirus salmonis]CAF2849291.1 PLCG1 [Lepeophtheirus salmonis]
MVGGGSTASSLLTIKELKIGRCERGIVVTRIPSASLPGTSSKKKKPDRKILAVRRETMLVVWHNKGHASRNRFEGSIDIRDIKEIRGASNKSRDFDRCTEEAIQNVKPSRCFVILYGKEFNLKTFSCVTISEEECNDWIEGLSYLLEDVATASYKHEQERWFRKGFYQFEIPGKEGCLGLTELKKFLHKISYKIPNSVLKEKFGKYDRSSTGEISFDDFCNILQELLLTRDLFKDVFGIYSSDGRRVTLQEFKKFLEKDHPSIDEDVGAQMRKFLQDTSRDVKDPYFTIYEFMDWLFSKNNRIYLESEIVDQSMNRPLSHYWISSSHNTYLTGDQISSDSSVEAYARCLRMGCRSVELDCWDGPEDAPIIYHGHTLTSKIKFHDVIKTIKENAFVTSEYPVILSIEDHCTLTQQRKMASLFESVFGDMLVSAPLEKNETALPSPDKLKYRIILKHKKLPEGADEVVITEDSIRRGDGGIDIASSVKNGILFLQEQESEEWEPNFFVLTQNKMYYSEVHANRDDEEEDLESTIDEDSELNASIPSTSSQGYNIDSSEQHFGETWFHSNMKNGRSTAEQLLKCNTSLGEGTFLVRPSETFVGDYSLSFLRQGKVFHVPIKSRQNNGRLRYYLIDQNFFDSLYALISYYKKNPVKSARFSITLNRACPPPNPHETKSWFKNNYTREQAECYLNHVNTDGAFIVRVGERMHGTFAISFRAENKVKHCLIKPEGRFYSIGSLQFESLVKLVNYYLKNPLYKKIRLKLAPNDETYSTNLSSPPIMSNGGDFDSGINNNDENAQGYFDPSTLNSNFYVRARYDYQNKRDDELNLVKNCIVSNVKKCEGGWWLGDYGGRKQHWFPANYVVEIDPPPSEDDSRNPNISSGGGPLSAVDSQAPLGNMQKGVWDITAAKVDILDGLNVFNSEREPLWVLRIDCPSPNERKEYRVGTTSKDEALQWKLKIQETGQTASHREDENRKNERAMRVARELSNLVIYCRSVVFNLDYYLRQKDRNPMEMSSFPETKAEKLMTSNSSMFLWYHRVQLSRVYPKAQRVDSSNYNPLSMWNVGSQMTALNYQTGDKPMQINVGRFMQNGKCGYVLRPEFMFSPSYVPGDPKSLKGVVEPFFLGVRILAARHLTRSKNKNSIISPNVEVEVLGAEYDNFKNRTRSINDNGFNPVWDEFFDFTIQNPQLALIRFTVYDYDIFGENNFIGQYTCPLIGIQTGYRSVPLKNAYSEPLELSALLVHITVENARGQSYELHKLRESAHDLQRQSDLSHERGDDAMIQKILAF